MTETKKAFRLLFVGLVVSIAVGVFSIAVLLPILPDIDRDRYPENLQQQGNCFPSRGPMEVRLTCKLGEDGERQPAPAGFSCVLIN